MNTAVFMEPLGLSRVVLHMIRRFGCSLAVLACTELSCIPLTGHVKERTLDAMDVLAERAIALSGGVVRQDVPVGRSAAGK